VRSAAAKSISAATIIAPSADMASAVARPMPAPAPVTSTALSCKTGILSSSTDIWLTRLRRRCAPRNGNSFVQSRGSAIFLPAGSARRPPVLALDDVSLAVGDREFLALLGPSGCGKSTLLYLVGGFLPVEQGTIRVEGRPVDGPGPDRGIVFQHFALFPWKTVTQNVLYGLEKRGLPRGERLRVAREFIELVGLTGFEDSYPAQLSGGMKQRAAIARTLAIDPSILLMDEPFGALDAQTRSLMQAELLRIWQRSRKTVIFVTHDVQEAVFLAERIAVMSARPGHIKEIVEARFDRDDPERQRSRQFVEMVDHVWNLVRGEAILAERSGAA
jgi:NitT/TauT family transport system ATP-binding protein